MIKIDKLSRNFGSLKAVDEISFCIRDQEIVGFLGPNGAGKTTTLRMMVGYLQPNSGNIEIDGVSIFADPLKASRQIGYLPEQNPLYDDMTVFEALAYFASLRRLKRDYFQERLKFVVKNCGLKEVLFQRIGTLSKGYRQRTGLAQAILHDPRILILDEPTSGLDPNQIIEIRELIRNLGKEKMVLLSSHIMQEVQALCDRVVIISKGKIIVDDAIEKLPGYLKRSKILNLEVQGENIDFSAFLALHPSLELEILSRDETSCKIVFYETPEIDLRQELSRFISDRGWLILELSSGNISLESIFYELTGADSSESELSENANQEEISPVELNEPDAAEEIKEQK